VKHTLGIALLAATLTSAVVVHAFAVKPGPEGCRNAHAVLVASSTGQHDVVWRAVGEVVKEGHGRWQVVDDYEPGVAMRVSFRQYDVGEGASAYVAHCGHGGTCNELAKAFFAKHDDWYSPEVFCGSVPDRLSNPRSVTLP
jgi:hypothetical protein